MTRSIAALFAAPLAALLVGVSLLGAPCAYAKSDALTKTGDILQIVLPLSALALTLPYRDAEGAGQFLKAGAFTGASTFALKYAVDATRPDGGRHAFPSGHTAAAFAGASFVARRYGWRLGLPYYAAASVVAWSRVDAERHHVGDVVGGAVLAIASTYLFVDPLPLGIQVTPVMGQSSYGLMISGVW